MHNQCTELVDAFHALQHATNDVARRSAAGRVYIAAHPALTRRCDSLLQRCSNGSWMSGEDLASDALLHVVLDRSRPGECRLKTATGILAFLRSVAYHDLLDERDQRAQRDKGITTMSLHSALTMPPAVEPSVQSENVDAFWVTYESALSHLSADVRRAWTSVIEQETPITTAATELGLHRATVWRHLRRAAAQLRVDMAGIEEMRSQHRARDVNGTSAHPSHTRASSASTTPVQRPRGMQMRGHYALSLFDPTADDICRRFRS
jgi:DNA-directed RNA polymerase specialized sigma24 family protein